jgi:molybdopterin converting factor small subunit
MSTEISLPPAFQALADGAGKISVAGSTVGECLRELVRRYPQLQGKIFTGKGRTSKGLNIFINRENAFPDPLSRPVSEGDKIHLSYLILGG